MINPCFIRTISTSFLAFVFYPLLTVGQTIPAPSIIDVIEDDRMATIYWNSKTNTYHPDYDPDKQAGVMSYLIEWGKQTEGYTHEEVTPYRIHQIQPLDVGEVYIARVFGLDNFGNKSEASAEVTFQHDDSRVTAMSQDLNGFFDDMNYPMGAFSERDWNQSYSGCMAMGKVSQHINDQFHGHNVLASGSCDRGIASSRLRHEFDFTDRTGHIEFDLDGSKRDRQLWYLDLTPASTKRDLTGHTSVIEDDVAVAADPAYMLRFVEVASTVIVQLVDADGYMHIIPDIYQNGACGNGLEWCPGENLTPASNVRRHWEIEVSKTHVKVFINDILIVDGSLITEWTPAGLPYEVAQVNWLFFSYNTSKENLSLSMLHWDNFGIDAPPGYEQTTVIHNYTDGNLGTDTGQTGNEGSIGKTSSMTGPTMVSIPIPDDIDDLNGAPPLSTELMFCIQGGTYAWSADDEIIVNGHAYALPEPSSDIVDFPVAELISTNKPLSVILPIDPAHLTTGDNQIGFRMNDPRLMNIHIELTYPIDVEPVYTPPMMIHAGHMADLMAFHAPAQLVGPGFVFESIDDVPLYMDEFEEVTEDGTGHLSHYIKQTPVCGIVDMQVSGNCEAQLIALGKCKGISHFDILVDEEVVQTIVVNEESPVAFVRQDLQLNTLGLTDGEHELFVRGYDVNGNPSSFDAFQAHSLSGDYLPIHFVVDNSAPESCASWPNCPADINSSDEVDVNDFLLLNSVYGQSCTCPEDIDQSGQVDIGDFLLFNSGFGSNCQ